MGITQVAKIMASPDAYVKAMHQNSLFSHVQRIKPQTPYTIEEALAIIEAIGKYRNSKFRIDEENRFTYENFVKWCHCDESMQALNPFTNQIVQGRLNSGIYIAGNTGSGKSWCLEIMKTYCEISRFKIQFVHDREPEPLRWMVYRADSISDIYTEQGTIKELKKEKMLCIQDLGCEPAESFYMGNRSNVLRSVLEYRGDMAKQLTFISSNFKLNGDNLKQMYGDRVASRLCEMCNYFEIKGRDRRKIHLQY